VRNGVRTHLTTGIRSLFELVCFKHVGAKL
jgi:hypothetical protein